MAHKKRGQLTTSSEWWRHLRPELRRFFWRGERRAERVAIAREVVELDEPFDDISVDACDAERRDLKRESSEE